jgi:hypothetical protein
LFLLLLLLLPVSVAFEPKVSGQQLSIGDCSCNSLVIEFDEHLFVCQPICDYICGWSRVAAKRCFQCETFSGFD